MPTHRVALVGAGPVAQAIHLPTLARLGPSVRVTEVMDVDAGLAGSVAAPHGARASASLDELLAGGGFEIAVIGSPERFHAEQVETLCAAGVRGILVEKPLATSLAELERVTAAAAANSVALVVGAMHTYDPAWLAAGTAFEAKAPVHARSAIYLPGNARFEDQATTMLRPAPTGGAAPDAVQKLRGGILGLAIHNLPLIRRYLPRLVEVSFATPLDPWGYSVTASGPEGTLELLARAGGSWRPDWVLSVWAGEAELEVVFPPSYVPAGSATATISRGADRVVFGPYPDNGYLAEWQELLRILAGGKPRYPIGTLADDLGYALALADLATAAYTGDRGAA